LFVKRHAAHKITLEQKNSHVKPGGIAK